MSINYVAISGNLGADAELRATQGGMAILSFRVAVNDRRRDPQTNEWTDYTNWISCSMFGNRAQSLAQYLTKGTKVSCAGKLRWSQWEDKNTGQKRSSVEVIVDEIEFLSQRQQNGPQSAPQPGYAPQTRQGYQSATKPQMAPQQPQMAPQGYAAAPGVYQQAIPQQAPVYQPQAQQDDLFQDDIPFDIGHAYV